MNGRKIVLAFIVTLSMMVSVTGSKVWATDVPVPPKNPTVATMTIGEVGFAQTALKVSLDAPLGQVSVTVAPAARKALDGAKVGDEIIGTLDDATQPKQITAITQVTRPLPTEAVLKYAGLSAAAAIIVIVLLSLFATGKFSFRAFLVGVDNRYSSSQVQVAMWFGAFLIVYVAALAERFFELGFDFVGGVAAPTNLIVLTGFSAFTFGAAKAITQSKVNDAVAANAPVTKAPVQQPKFFPDLLRTDDDKADFGNAQMLIIVGLAVIIFLFSAWHYLANLPVATTSTLPDVDTSLLTMFGLGQGAYLVKKAASNVGQG